MDVTPRELRDTDIREGFRGYHRDDVDELLERAASTVEGLTERVRQLTDRLQNAEGSAGKSRETEEMLQRTLVLAQKTADEAIAEAQERARTLLEESETKARNVVNEAEGTARRVAENERARLESEVQDLSARRDALNADVEALEKYEKEYRTRLRKAIESELDSLGKFSAQHGQRPKLHDVSVPSPREAVANSGRPSSPSPPPGRAAPPAPPPGPVRAAAPPPGRDRGGGPVPEGAAGAGAERAARGPGAGVARPGGAAVGAGPEAAGREHSRSVGLRSRRRAGRARGPRRRRVLRDAA